MLPDYRAKLKKAAAEASGLQLTLDSSLEPIPEREQSIPYSEEAYRRAALEWLIATDQVSPTLYLL